MLIPISPKREIGILIRYQRSTIQHGLNCTIPRLNQWLLLFIFPSQLSLVMFYCCQWNVTFFADQKIKTMATFIVLFLFRTSRKYHQGKRSTRSELKSKIPNSLGLRSKLVETMSWTPKPKGKLRQVQDPGLFVLISQMAFFVFIQNFFHVC